MGGEATTAKSMGRKLAYQCPLNPNQNYDGEEYQWSTYLISATLIHIVAKHNITVYYCWNKPILQNTSFGSSLSGRLHSDIYVISCKSHLICLIKVCDIFIALSLPCILKSIPIFKCNNSRLNRLFHSRKFLANHGV